LLYRTNLALPEGYGLLSVLGAGIEDHYVAAGSEGRRLHVLFGNGAVRRDVSLVCVQRAGLVAELTVPTVRLPHAAGRPLASQSGRLAVQTAAAFDVRTIGVKKPSPDRAGGAD